MSEILENTKAFIEECRKKTKADENKLLSLIDAGIDVNHRVYKEGSQRFDDGNYWGGCFRLIHYALDTNSVKVMEKLLEQSGIEMELYSGYQCVHWGYSNAAWLRDAFYYIKDDCKHQNYDDGISVLLSSSKLRDSELFEEGFKCLSEQAQQKWIQKVLKGDKIDDWKVDTLMASYRFSISKKEDLKLLPKLKQAHKISIDFQEITIDDALYALSELQDGKLEILYFENFPKGADEQKPLIKVLASLKNVDFYHIGDAVWKQIKEEIKRQEAAKHEGEEEWKVDFYQNLSLKNYRYALDILKKQGVFEPKQQSSKAEFGREFDLSPLGWGHNSLEVYNDLIGLDIKDLGNNRVAIGQIYEDRKWYSTVGYDSGIGWYWNAEVAVVDLNKGVGAKAETGILCVRDPHDVSRDIFGNIDREDFLTIESDRAVVRMGSYASAGVMIPKDEPVKVSRRKQNSAHTKDENIHE